MLLLFSERSIFIVEPRSLRSLSMWKGLSKTISSQAAVTMVTLSWSCSSVYCDTIVTAAGMPQECLYADSPSIEDQLPKWLSKKNARWRRKTCKGIQLFQDKSNSDLAKAVHKITLQLLVTTKWQNFFNQRIMGSLWLQGNLITKVCERWGENLLLEWSKTWLCTLSPFQRNDASTSLHCQKMLHWIFFANQH